MLAKREGGTVRVTIDIDARIADFLYRYADHRNRVTKREAQAEVEAGKRKKSDPVVTWQRKNLIESLVEGIGEDLQATLAAMTKKLGPLPDPKENSDCETYADEAFEWLKKNRG